MSFDELDYLRYIVKQYDNHKHDYYGKVYDIEMDKDDRDILEEAIKIIEKENSFEIMWKKLKDYCEWELKNMSKDNFERYYAFVFILKELMPEIEKRRNRMIGEETLDKIDVLYERIIHPEIDVIDELEKLRKELVECAFEGYDYGIQGMILELDDILKEIDNRIARLRE